MIYSEAAYFDGNHCQHVVAFQDEQARKRERTKIGNLLRRERRTGSRAYRG